jgi:hypothetical protein
MPQAKITPAPVKKEEKKEEVQEVQKEPVYLVVVSGNKNYNGDFKIPVKVKGEVDFCTVYVKDGVVINTAGVSIVKALESGTLPVNINIFQK